MILDLGLPDLDGLDVLEGLRERGSAVPVLVLSARGRVGDRVTGLNLGADDYLGKPFAFEELLARVRTNLRPRATGPPGVLQAGRISIDPLRREVTVDGRAVSLSAREFYLLLDLEHRPGGWRDERLRPRRGAACVGPEELAATTAGTPKASARTTAPPATGSPWGDPV